MTEVTARQLPPEKLHMKNDQFSYKIEEADWSREMRGKPLISAVNLTNWVVVFTNRSTNIVEDFVETLKKVAGPFGMNVSDPERLRINDDSERTFVHAIKENVNASSGTQMVVALTPNNRKDRYDGIKKLCNVEFGVPCQIVVERTLSKKQQLMSMCTKIALQMNSKMDGEMLAVDIPLKSLMVVGVDSYPDSSRYDQSVCAMVASTNKYITKFYSRTEYIDTRAGVMQRLGDHLSHALNKYQEANNAFPEKVIIYRAGVSDQQLDAVVESERMQIEQAFQTVGHKPEYAMIIVDRRSNTKIFHPDGPKSISNPVCGTVLDNCVTRPEWYQFFLVSLSQRQGTVSPTSYNIVYDDTDFKPDHFQRLSYKLTHLYVNWPGTVGVPAPCQYAKKLAMLQAESLGREFNENLRERLFFL